MDFFIYERNCCQFFKADFPTQGENLGSKLHPRVDFLDHDFYNLENSSQDLSNEGSNFILRQLEVGH